MSDKQGMSKRQARREQIRKKEQRSRYLTIGVVTIVALLFGFVFIYPNFKPTGEVFDAPQITRTQVDFNTTGDPNAPIRIDEYSDFQCPFCRRFFENTEEQLVSQYVDAGVVYFVYHSFGDFIGPESANAAEAAYCAGDQGKFWEMHDIIFTNQTGENVGAFSDRRLMAFGEKLELDMDAYRTCYNNGTYASMVDDDAKSGVKANVTATPSFILSYTVNGEVKTTILEGAQSIDVFQQSIDAALAEMGQ